MARRDVGCCRILFFFLYVRGDGERKRVWWFQVRRSCFHWDSFSGNVLIPHIGSFVMVKKIFGTKNLIKFFSCMYVGMCVYLNIRICILKTV